MRARATHYQNLILAVLHAFPVSTDKLSFVLGSSYQLSKQYTLDNFKLCATVTEDDAKNAEPEEVAQASGGSLSALLYPGLQALDEEYLDSDFQYGGVDQVRSLFPPASAKPNRRSYHAIGLYREKYSNSQNTTSLVWDIDSEHT